MEARAANAGLLARAAPQLERFLNRNILGIEPDPDHWPAPPDLGRIVVPRGIVRSDDDGKSLILSREFVTGWPRRRTVIGAHAFRFENNAEYDCGWRLCDAAARFIRQHCSQSFVCATIVPPPDTFDQIRVLPWIAERLAQLLSIAYQPNLFEKAGPLALHPDSVRRPALPLTGMFHVGDEYAASVKDSRVLLLDWRRHSGRTLLTLTRMLRKKGAQVVRFAWLG